MRDIKQYITESQRNDESVSSVLLFAIKNAGTAIKIIEALAMISSIIVSLKGKYDNGEIKSKGDLVKTCIADVQSVIDNNEDLQKLFRIARIKISDYVNMSLEKSDIQ